MHSFTYQKTFHTLFCLFLKSSKAFSVSLNSFVSLKGSKKMTLMREVVAQNLKYTKGQQIVFNVCVTLWVDNLDGFSMFLIIFPYIIDVQSY